MPVGLGRRFLPHRRRDDQSDVAAEQPVSHQPEPQPDPTVVPAPIPEPEPADEPDPSLPDQPPEEPEPTQPRIAVVPAAAPDQSALVPRGDVGTPEPQVVSLAARATSPREWNLWELERLARATAGGDVARDEERGYLLMYLRDFANADGVLPADFDGVVRESFGDVLDAVHS